MITWKASAHVLDAIVTDDACGAVPPDHVRFAQALTRGRVTHRARADRSYHVAETGLATIWVGGGQVVVAANALVTISAGHKRLAHALARGDWVSAAVPAIGDPWCVARAARAGGLGVKGDVLWVVVKRGTLFALAPCGVVGAVGAHAAEQSAVVGTGDGVAVALANLARVCGRGVSGAPRFVVVEREAALALRPCGVVLAEADGAVAGRSVPVADARLPVRVELVHGVALGCLLGLPRKQTEPDVCGGRKLLQRWVLVDAKHIVGSRSIASVEDIEVQVPVGESVRVRVDAVHIGE